MISLHVFSQNIKKCLKSSKIIFHVAGLIFILICFYLWGRVYYRQSEREEFKKEITYLSYKMNDIEVCSFQVLANESLNFILQDYVAVNENYQVDKWNREFSTYVESFIADNDFVRDVIFFPLDNVKKKALTVREYLTFSEIEAARTLEIQNTVMQLDGKFCWTSINNLFLGMRLLKVHNSTKPMGILCFYIDVAKLKIFIKNLQYISNIIITDHNQNILFPLENKGNRIIPKITHSSWYKFKTKYIYASLIDQGLGIVPLKIISFKNIFMALFFYSPVLLIMLCCCFLFLIYIYYKKQAVQKKVFLTTKDKDFFLQFKNKKHLSNREAVILELLCDGLSSKEIAYTLKLQEQTIKNYTSGLYKKLGVNNRVAACQLINSLYLQKKS